MKWRAIEKSVILLPQYWGIYQLKPKKPFSFATSIIKDIL